MVHTMLASEGNSNLVENSMNETMYLKISSGRHLKPVLHEHLRLN